MLVPPESSSAVLVMLSSKSLSIGKRSDFARKKLETIRYHIVKNPESLSRLGLNRYPVVTDRQTDRQNYDS